MSDGRIPISLIYPSGQIVNLTMRSSSLPVVNALIEATQQDTRRHVVIIGDLKNPIRVGNLSASPAKLLRDFGTRMGWEEDER